MEKKKYDLITDKLNEAMDMVEVSDSFAIMVFVGQKEDDGLRYTSGARGEGRVLAEVICNNLIDNPSFLTVVDAAVERAKEEIEQHCGE